MKTALLLLLPLACAAALFGGCSTNQGGAETEYYSQNGTVYESEPPVANPSIPESSGEGGSLVPPP